MSGSLGVKMCCLEVQMRPELSLKGLAEVIPARTQLEDILAGDDMKAQERVELGRSPGSRWLFHSLKCEELETGRR